MKIIWGWEAECLEKYRKKYFDLSDKYCAKLSENYDLKYRIEELEEELAKIKPVVETSGFKPAVSDKCEHCKYAYFSDYKPNELLGCCKDAVCPDFESTVKVEE